MLTHHRTRAPLIWAAIAFVVAACEADAPTGPNRATLKPSDPLFNSQGSDTECASPLFPAGAYDNVIVPPGRNCVMSNSTVRGSVKVLEGGQLWATSNEIAGNVDGEKSRYVWLDDNTIHGSISVKEGGPDPLPVWFCRNIVIGNMHVEKTVHRGALPTDGGGIIIGSGAGCPGVGGGNTVGGNLTAYENVIGPTIGGFSITINTVRGNLQVYKTRGPGPRHVNANFVHQNLQCFDNDDPFDGAFNTAKQAQGQCTAAPLPLFGSPLLQ